MLLLRTRDVLNFANFIKGSFFYSSVLVKLDFCLYSNVYKYSNINFKKKKKKAICSFISNKPQRTLQNTPVLILEMCDNQCFGIEPKMQKEYRQYRYRYLLFKFDMSNLCCFFCLNYFVQTWDRNCPKLVGVENIF